MSKNLEGEPAKRVIIEAGRAINWAKYIDSIWAECNAVIIYRKADNTVVIEGYEPK